MKTVHELYDSAKDPLVGTLLRVPFMHARHHIVTSLRAAGFDDLSAAHLAVFQFPGPSGRTPGDIARAAGSSKQAINNLLSQLERAGYLVRVTNEDNRRERIIELTARGVDAIATIRRAIVELEESWSEALGTREYGQLRALLTELNRIVEGVPSN